MTKQIGILLISEKTANIFHHYLTLWWPLLSTKPILTRNQAEISNFSNLLIINQLYQAHPTSQCFWSPILPKMGRLFGEKAPAYRRRSVGLSTNKHQHFDERPTTLHREADALSVYKEHLDDFDQFLTQNGSFPATAFCQLISQKLTIINNSSFGSIFPQPKNNFSKERLRTATRAAPARNYLISKTRVFYCWWNASYI